MILIDWSKRIWHTCLAEITYTLENTGSEKGAFCTTSPVFYPYPQTCRSLSLSLSLLPPPLFFLPQICMHFSAQLLYMICWVPVLSSKWLLVMPKVVKSQSSWNTQTHSSPEDKKADFPSIFPLPPPHYPNPNQSLPVIQFRRRALVPTSVGVNIMRCSSTWIWWDHLANCFTAASLIFDLVQWKHVTHRFI